MAAAKKSTLSQPTKSPPTADSKIHSGGHFCLLNVHSWLFRHSTDLRRDSNSKCCGGAGAGNEEVESPLSVSYADTSPHKWGEVKRTCADLTSPRLRVEEARAQPVAERGLLRLTSRPESPQLPVPTSQHLPSRPNQVRPWAQSMNHRHKQHLAKTNNPSRSSA